MLNLLSIGPKKSEVIYVTDNYAETFRYDANGNILQLNRNGHSHHPGDQAMDRLNYTFRDGLSTP